MRACRRPSSAPQPSTSVIVVLDPVGVIFCFMVFPWLLFLCRVRFTPTECHRSQMTILKLFLFSGAILVQLKSAVVVLQISADLSLEFSGLVVVFVICYTERSCPMTFVSLADACRHLGIDPKTLRRWLAHAHLPLHPHPSDGRKHGLSEDHLRLLAHLHQRALPTLPQDEPPASAPGVPAALPSPLLALPELLGALHAQLDALQEQITALTHALQQHPPVSAVPGAAARQIRRGPQPASPASPSRPAAVTAKPPRKPTHAIPQVERGSAGHYVVICPKQGLLALEPDSPTWFTWLATQSAFRFVGQHGRFTAHHEVERVPNGAWRAHRQIRHHSYNLRLGLTQELSITLFEHTADTLEAHLNYPLACLWRFQCGRAPASFQQVPP